MAKTDPALIPGAATGELAHGSLRLWDAIAISVSVIAPGMAMLLNVTGVAAVAGGSTPLAFLLGGIACLALASGVERLEEHTSELQSHVNLVCRLLLEKKK